MTEVTAAKGATSKSPAKQPAEQPASEILGVTTCSNCRARFRIQKKHERLVGKAIRCPKCHREFVMQVERPSAVEQAAIQNAQQNDGAKGKRKKRTQSQIRQEHFRRIKQAFRAYHKRLSAISEQAESSEEEVRRWCIDVLRGALGYADEEIDTEMYALNQRIDIALKSDDKVFMVVECKNIRAKLSSKVRDQALMYAVNKSADWAVVTNGQIWKLYRVFPVKGADPQSVEVFDLAVLDEDGVSDDDVESLYLLTSRAVFRGDTEKIYHRIACLTHRRVLSAISSPRVARVVRKVLCESYKSECKEVVKLTDEAIVERLQELFLPADL